MIDTSGLPFPRPTKRIKPKRGMNAIGKVGRARLKVVEELDDQWSDAPWYNTCEIWRILRDRGYITSPQCICIRPITWAHARKHRPATAPLGSPESHYTAARACSYHHMSVMDLLAPAIVESVVLEAIARRISGE